MYHFVNASVVNMLARLAVACVAVCMQDDRRLWDWRSILPCGRHDARQPCNGSLLHWCAVCPGTRWYLQGIALAATVLSDQHYQNMQAHIVRPHITVLTLHGGLLPARAQYDGSMVHGWV